MQTNRCCPVFCSQPRQLIGRMPLSMILSISLAYMVLPASATDIIPFGSEWAYLHSTNGLDGDPELDDDEFLDNWTLTDYDTSFPIEWSAPAPAPFAYGSPDADGNPNAVHVEAFMPDSDFFVREPGTLLPQPPSGDRYTTYFRHQFTLDTAASDTVN